MKKCLNLWLFQQFQVLGGDVASVSQSSFPSEDCQFYETKPKLVGNCQEKQFPRGFY